MSIPFSVILVEGVESYFVNSGPDTDEIQTFLLWDNRLAVICIRYVQLLQYDTCKACKHTEITIAHIFAQKDHRRSPEQQTVVVVVQVAVVVCLDRI